MQGKTSISGVHTFRKLNSDGLYPILRTIYRPRKSTELSGVSRLTINQLLFKLRTRIAQIFDASSPFSGEVEVDESSFNGRRVRGKKGRGTGGKRLSSGFWNATRNRYRPQSRAAWPSIASSTRTARGAMMGWWIKGIKSISVWIMSSMNLPVVIALSMALNHS